MLAELRIILDLRAQKPEFISAILQESPQRPAEILVFELWHGMWEDFARVQGPKRYRKDSIERSKLLYESVQATFSTPVAKWKTALLGVSSTDARMSTIRKLTAKVTTSSNMGK